MTLISSSYALPSAKILCLNSLLQQWARRRCCTRMDLESLLGHLSHAAIVIKPGRIFLASLFSLLSVVSHPSHFIRLNVKARTDLGWWHCLMKHWNGRSFFPLPEPSVHVFSDASGSFGCGAFCGNSWFQVQWPNTWASTSIAEKELVPVVMAAALWGSGWAGQYVCFHSDNEAVVTVILRSRARCPLFTQLLCCLFFYASYFGFHFTAGVNNIVADAISRNHLSLLSSMLPQVSQTQIPQPVAGFLLELPDWGSPLWIQQFTSSLPTESPRQLPVHTGLASVSILPSALGIGSQVSPYRS